MAKNRIQFRHILLLCFREGKTPKEARQRICDLYGKGAISIQSCYSWYTRFRSGDLSVEDASRSGRPAAIDDSQILELIKTDGHMTAREMGEILGVDFTTVAKRLKGMGMIKTDDGWVPTEANSAK